MHGPDACAGIFTHGSARVLDRRGRTIARLHAAGDGALSTPGEISPGQGTALEPTMTFGGIVGRHLAGET